MAIAAYSFSHFAVDLGCAYAIFSGHISPVVFLLYNFFAFAMQMPLGLLADSIQKNRLFALLGIGITALCCCVTSLKFPIVCLLGLGNALFHIGGGSDILNHSGEKAAPLGIFVSPGAFGVFLGTMLGKEQSPAYLILIVLALAAAATTLFVKSSSGSIRSVSLPNSPAIFPAILLFGVVLLRSLGSGAQFPWKTGIYPWFAIGAVVLGKALGGILADRFGTTCISCVSLLFSALFFAFGSYAPAGLLGLLLFNMTMPITLMALCRKMPGAKGFSFGILTFALFLGFLPFYFGAGGVSLFAMVAIAIVSAILLLPALKEGAP